MKQNMPIKLIVNGVGALAAIVVVWWIVSTAVTTEEAAICRGRYPVATRLSLASDTGQPVSPSELQARFGSSEWGLLGNARVLPPIPGGKEPILAVTIAKGTGSGYQVAQERGGVGLVWRPVDLLEAQPRAACLSYRLFLPKDMQFSSGGTLPGLSIGARFDPRGEPVVGEGAVARLGWNREGFMYVGLQFATREGWKNPLAFPAKKPWPLGRWVDVEQEIILNDVGKKNGVIRLWVDQTLMGETEKAGLRGDPALAMSGMIADVNFGNITTPAEAESETEIRLSSFVLRWQ
jgi:hypothetical protein